MVGIRADSTSYTTSFSINKSASTPIGLVRGGANTSFVISKNGTQIYTRTLDSNNKIATDLVNLDSGNYTLSIT